MDRPLSEPERAVLGWMLDDVDEYRAQIPGLRVRGVCGCGCPSIDFVPSGTPWGSAVGRPGWIRGEAVLLELFASDGHLTGLEVTDFVGSRQSLPDPRDLVDTPPN